MKTPALNPRAWLLWLIAAAALSLLTRNPLYLILILLAAQRVTAVYGKVQSGWQFPIRRIAFFILLFSTLFNALFIHIGQTVLFTLPRNWGYIGGPITLESVAYGVINGLILLTLLAVFAAFNRIVPVSDLVRLVPAAFQDVGIVILIAITYVPETLQQLQRIREAQAIRGHRLRGVRDWRPLVLPLLVSGLERALTLSETMVARGYGRSHTTRHPLATQMLLLLSLIVALVGWVAAFWIGTPGWMLLALGGGGLLLIIRQLSRQSIRTQYRPQAWTRHDVWVIAAALIPLTAVLFPLPFIDRAALQYAPYPELTLPPFDPWLGLAVACLALPTILEFGR